MVHIIGLTELLPNKESVTKVSSPPYDVIKKGTELENILKTDNKLPFYVYEQIYPEEELTEVFVRANPGYNH